MIKSALLAASAAVALSFAVPAANAAPLGGIGNIAVQPADAAATVEKVTFFRYGYSDGRRYGRRNWRDGNWRYRHRNRYYGRH